MMTDKYHQQTHLTHPPPPPQPSPDQTHYPGRYTCSLNYIQHDILHYLHTMVTENDLQDACYTTSCTLKVERAQVADLYHNNVTQIPPHRQPSLDLQLSDR
ncbi:hypothetical protein LSH36_73g05012 [Paralvinella palmiformis]|uniref:Uncharacterized protein n=1 Tax=Paralvinella palmiformis TaxID=53620 RepID=A0AAD9K2R1_9ANNE|nr:hypothetical protein LSH36_73g05012 [Paralvinella palmiformis]